MPFIDPTYNYTIIGNEGAIALDVTEPARQYIFKGTASLTGGLTISAAAPEEPMIIDILWNAVITLAGFNLSILGTNLTADEAAKPGWYRFLFVDGAWQPVVMPDMQRYQVFNEVVSTDVSAGAAITLNPALDKQTQVLTGSGALGGNVTVATAGTPQNGDEFFVLYKGLITKGANNITIFGKVLTTQQVLKGSVLVHTKYNGTTYDTVVQVDVSTTEFIETSMVLAKAITLAEMADGTPAEFILYNAGGVATAVSMGGDATMSSTGVVTIAVGVVTFAMMADLTANSLIGRNAGTNGVPSAISLTGAQIAIGQAAGGILGKAMGGDVSMADTGITTIANNVIAVANRIATVNTEVLNIPVSFETGEICDNRIKMPYDGTVQEIYGVVTTAIEATDDGTVTAKDGAGVNITAGLLTFTAADPLETAVTVTPSANNTFVAGDILRFTTAKTTAGGKVLLSIKVLRT